MDATPKMWWTSKGMIGAVLVALISVVAGVKVVVNTAFPGSVPDSVFEAITGWLGSEDTVTTLAFIGTAIGGLIALIGRGKATAPIAPNILPGGKP